MKTYQDLFNVYPLDTSILRHAVNSQSTHCSINCHLTTELAAAMTHWFRTFDLKMEGRVVETLPPQIIVVKTSSDSSNAKRRWMHVSRVLRYDRTDGCHSACGTLKNPHYLMISSADRMLNFAALHRYLSQKVSHGTQKSENAPTPKPYSIVY